LRLPSEYCGPAGAKAKGNESKSTFATRAAGAIRINRDNILVPS
jgi:hypothetical protein